MTNKLNKIPYPIGVTKKTSLAQLDRTKNFIGSTKKNFIGSTSTKKTPLVQLKKLSIGSTKIYPSIQYKNSSAQLKKLNWFN